MEVFQKHELCMDTRFEILFSVLFQDEPFNAQCIIETLKATRDVSGQFVVMAYHTVYNPG
jgi:hypothetical protein